MQPAGTELRPYGLWLLNEYRTAGRLILVEGESDVWTGRHHGLPVLGIPGANAVGKCLESCLPLLTGFTEVLVWQEPDGGGEHFVSRAGPVLAKVPGLTARIISGATVGVKDVSALHLANPDPAAFRAAFDAILAAAGPMPVAEVSRVSTPVADLYRGDDGPGSATLDVRIARCARYLERLPASVAGQGGSSALMWAARVVRWGFCLDESTCLHLLREHFNPRCQPEWSDHDLKHKLADADRPGFGYRKGWLLEQQRDHHPTDAYKDDPFFTEFARGDRPASPVSAPIADIASLPPDPPSPPVAPHRDCACSDDATATLAVTEAVGQKVGSVPASPPCELPPIGIEVTRCPSPAVVPMRGRPGTPSAGITVAAAFRCRRWPCPGCRTWHQHQHAEKIRLTIRFCTGVGNAPRIGVGTFDLTDRKTVAQSLRRAGAEFVTIRTTREAVSLSLDPGRKTNDVKPESGTAAVLVIAVMKPTHPDTPAGFRAVGVTEACESLTAALLGIPQSLPGEQRLRPVNYSTGWNTVLCEQPDGHPEHEVITEQCGCENGCVCLPEPAKMERAGTKMAVTFGDVRQVLHQIGVPILPPARNPSSGVQGTIGWRDEDAGGSTASRFLLELLQRPGLDGGPPTVGYITHQFLAWRPLLHGIKYGPLTRAILETRLGNTPDATDAMRLRLAERRDADDEMSHAASMGEFYNAKFCQHLWKRLC